MHTYTDYSGSGYAVGLIGVILAVYLVAILFIVVVNYLLYAIALSMFFRKVGVEPWIGWVPYYRTWKWLEVGGQQGFWSLFPLVSLSIVTRVFLYLGMWRSNIAFGKGTGIFVLGIFFPFIWLFIMASKSSVYRPDLITHSAFGPPLAGYGSAHQQPTT